MVELESGLFPGGVIPSKVGFSLYSSPSGSDLISAQSSIAQFESAKTQSINQSDDYLIAQFNPRTNKLVVSSTPLPVLTVRSVSHSAKRQAEDDQVASYIEQRTNLGLAFGTKKAIRELNTQQRNKLDQNSFGTNQSLSSVLVNQISSSTSSLPSSDQIEHSANLQRPIPRPNLSATEPKEVYDIGEVVPLNELNLIELNPIISAESFKDRLSQFPFRRSRFIQNKLRQLFPQSREGQPISSKDRTKLGYLVHLSYLLAFRQVATPNKDHQLTRNNLADKLSAPLVVIDGLLDRYTELMITPTERKRKVTSSTQAKLLGFGSVLILYLDNWSTDVGLIASDLGIGESKVQELFKSVGCSMVSPSAGERDRLLELGIAKTLTEAKRARKATLTVPLQFPKERKTKAKR
jgi:DNA-directed RNA polymerase I subunit RPA49